MTGYKKIKAKAAHLPMLEKTIRALRKTTWGKSTCLPEGGLSILSYMSINQSLFTYG